MRNVHARKRRKNTSGRKHAGKRAVQALAAGAVIAAGTQAYASPVRFDNPPGTGHFSWTNVAGQDVLDHMAGPAGQPGAAGAPATFQRLNSWRGSLVQGGTPFDNLQVSNLGGYQFLDGVASGEMIPIPGQAWSGGGIAYATNDGVYHYAGTRTLLLEGEPMYLGTRFDLGSGYHYGWVGVVRTGLELDAFAWGYETAPGVPIPAGAPEPGTLALLAFGAAALLRRR